MKTWLFGMVAAVSVSLAHAEVWVRVSNMSLLQYQTYPNGYIYLRNLNSFDSNALIGNYNYFIDTTTVEGKNIWAVALTAIAQGTVLNLGLPDGYAAGAVQYVGYW